MAKLSTVNMPTPKTKEAATHTPGSKPTPADYIAHAAAALDKIFGDSLETKRLILHAQDLLDRAENLDINATESTDPRYVIVRAIEYDALQTLVKELRYR